LFENLSTLVCLGFRILHSAYHIKPFVNFDSSTEPQSLEKAGEHTEPQSLEKAGEFTEPQSLEKADVSWSLILLKRMNPDSLQVTFSYKVGQLDLNCTRLPSAEDVWED
jgi:hypothetical protein